MAAFRWMTIVWIGLAASAPAMDHARAEHHAITAPPSPDAPQDTGEGEAIPFAWLGERITVEQAEAIHPGVTDDRIVRFPGLGRPFGGLSPEWEALKSMMKPGDALRAFASPPDSWQHLAGRAGIALVSCVTSFDVTQLTDVMNWCSD